MRRENTHTLHVRPDRLQRDGLPLEPARQTGPVQVKHVERQETHQGQAGEGPYHPPRPASPVPHPPHRPDRRHEICPVARHACLQAETRRVGAKATPLGEERRVLTGNVSRQDGPFRKDASDLPCLPLPEHGQL